MSPVRVPAQAYKFLLSFVLTTLSLLMGCGGGGGGSSSGGGGTVPPVTPTLMSIQLTPTAISLAVGGTLDLQSAGTYSDGTTNTAFDAQVTWTSSNNAVATVDSAGLVTGLAAGSSTITAAKGAVQATAQATVSPVTGATLTSLTLSPATGALTAGATLSLTPIGHYSDGTASNIVPVTTVAWSSSNPGAATVNGSGLVTGVGAGSVTITGTLSGKSGTAAITVSAVVAPTLTSITVSPSAPSLTVGGTLDLQATGNFSNGTATTPFDAQVTWTSSSTSVATVDAAGIVTALSVGNTTITATKGGIQGSATVTVTASAAPTLTSISISPSAPSLSVGATADLQATGNFSNGTSTTPFDSQVTWASSSTAVATVDAGGVVTALAVGTTTITATKGGIQGSATVTVTAVAAPTLISISLSPLAPSVSVGGTVDLQATGNYSNGTSTTPFDSQVTWSSSNPAVATVNAAGLVTALTTGTTTITAAKGGILGTVNVTVTMATRTLTGISLSPTNLSLSVGQLGDIAASAIWSDGTGSSGYNGSCTWTTSNAAVATVSTLGLVTPVGAGTATITAASSGKTATCAVTVTAATPTLSSLTLSPATGSIGVGGTLSLTPVGHYSDGSASNITPVTAVVWTSNNNAVASVNASGLVTGGSAGSATITGTLSGKSGSAVITVTAPSFDTRLVGNWKWIGFPDSFGNTYGSFYYFYANGTFTYELIYLGGTGCITTSQVVAHHQGTFSTQGGLDNLASAGQIIFNCSSHFTDYSNCSGATTRTSWTGTNPHFHWAAFGAGSLYTNHADDFQPTGNIQHVKY